MKGEETLEESLRADGWSEESIKSIVTGWKQAKRRETYYMYPRWKRVFNPFRRILFKYRHKYGKWKDLNE
jgi:hypothetical protein